MTEHTENLGLPYLQASQAQKHVTLNESLDRLDTLVQLVIEHHSEPAPPEVPAEGQAWIIAPSATGAWAGQSANIAVFRGGAWSILAPKPGWRAWCRSDGKMYVYLPEGWSVLSTGEAPERLPKLGINAEPDAENPFVVRAPNILFTAEETSSAGTGDVRLKLNCLGANDTATVVFQSNYVGRAEFGLSSTDEFALKTSANGTDFATAFSVDTASASLGIGTAPVAADPVSIRKDRVGASQVTIANLNADATSSVALRLSAAGNHYFLFQLYGSGTMYAYSNAALVIGTYAAKSLRLRTDTQDRLTIHADGRVSIGTAIASSQLAVNGAVRVGSSASGALPSASQNGAGAVLFVTGLAEGPVLVVSDGSVWRRLSLGAAV